MLELVNTQKEYDLCARLFAKLEYFNPAGSVKDRVAMQMLDDAEREGPCIPHSRWASGNGPDSSWDWNLFRPGCDGNR